MVLPTASPTTTCLGLCSSALSAAEPVARSRQPKRGSEVDVWAEKMGLIWLLSLNIWKGRSKIYIPPGGGVHTHTRANESLVTSRKSICNVVQEPHFDQSWPTLSTLGLKRNAPHFTGAHATIWQCSYPWETFLKSNLVKCRLPITYLSVVQMLWTNEIWRDLSWRLSSAPWACYQIRKITGCTCAGNAGNVFPATAG